MSEGDRRDQPSLQSVWYRLDSMDKTFERQLKDFDRRVETAMADIKRTIEGLQFVHAAVYQAEKQAMAERVLTLEDKIKWISRTAGAAVIGVIGSVIFAFFQGGGGG